MAPGWSADENAALMCAWAQTNEESGRSEDLYRHYLNFCEFESPKSRSVVIARKQTLRHACRLIASFLSLKSESGSGGDDESGAIGGSESEHEQARAWFRQTREERRAAFERINTSPSYAFVDVDEDSFWKILRYSMGSHLLKTAPRHEWDRDELLALLQAHEHALNEPPRRRQCSVERLTYRRFVSQCGGEVKRTALAVAAKLAAVKNMVAMILGYNDASQRSCTACFEKKSWFALSPAVRKAAFDERNSSPYRFFDLDEQLFHVAEKSVVRPNSQAIAEPPRYCEPPREGGDGTAPHRALAAAHETVANPRPSDDENREGETRDAEFAITGAVRSFDEMVVVAEDLSVNTAVYCCLLSGTARQEARHASPPEAERVEPHSAAQDVEETERRSDPTTCGGGAVCRHCIIEQETATAAWRSAHEADLAATKFALAQLKADMQQEHHEQERKRKHECDQALLDLTAKLESAEKRNQDHEEKIARLSTQLDEERNVHNAALVFLRDRVDWEASEREKLVEKMRVIEEDQLLYRKAERKHVDKWNHQLRDLERKRKAASSSEGCLVTQQPE